MHNYQELEIWKKSVEIVRDIYNLAETLPNVKEYGMTSKMMSTALSIPVNITKSTCSKSSKERLSFLENALESTFYLQIYLILIREVLWSKNEHNRLDIKIEGLLKLLQNEVKLIQPFLR